MASAYKAGINQGFPAVFVDRSRFPVLASWDFTCTGTGGFERLMNELKVGLLGTLDADQPPTAAGGGAHRPPRVVAPDPARRPGPSWYRGPLSPQPTVRTEAVDGVLALAHTSDQLRKVVPDGREDISQAAMFEIGRLLTLSKPTLVAAMMEWRRELFGAARARELADLLAGTLLDGIGTGIIGGRSSSRGAHPHARRRRVHRRGTRAGPQELGPRPRAPKDIDGPRPRRTPARARRRSGQDLQRHQGVRGRRARCGTGRRRAVDARSRCPAIDLAMARLGNRLGDRVAQLTVDALKLDTAVPHGEGIRRSSRKKDDLDRLIEQAAKHPEGR